MKYLHRIIIIYILINLFLFNYEGNYIAQAEFKNMQITVLFDQKKYKINDNFNNFINITELQKRNIKLEKKEKIELMKKLIRMGFSKEEIISYVYPYLYRNILELIKNEKTKEVNAYISVIKNTGNIELIKSKNGSKINKSLLFDDIFYNLTNNCNNIISVSSDIVYPKVNMNNIKEYSFLRSEFKTNFKNSNNERKTNISLALKSLDGVVINPGQIFSFNECVGERTSENGYKQAKIISKGKFIDAIGGGVCQVSTTLYNASILAGLEIIEVNPHSLKVGYIEPGFDAMVNSGVSDFKFKNNTCRPIIIATSNLNNECLIRIYGIENKLKYIRVYNCNEIFDSGSHENQNLLGYEASSSVLVYDNDKLIGEKNKRRVIYKNIYNETNSWHKRKTLLFRRS